MSGKPFYEDEVTGTYLGTLIEDMIVTVAREKKLVCNVDIPELFAKDYSYPLVYVPLWAMSLPLRKGDQVIVQFNQNDYLYPILYKNPSEIDQGFYKKFEFGNSVSGGNIQLPESSETISATNLGEDSYLIKTDKYTVIHQGIGFILIDNDGKVYIYGNEINVISKNTLKIDSESDISIFTSKKLNVNSNSDIEISSTGKTKVTCNSAEISCQTSCNITASGGFSVNNHLRVNP